jgi:chemosensory pili system protein ChpA (sensor histidine kinase/response regulator)
MVTSRMAEKHRRHGLELGVDAFFGKPYDEEELLARIAELLGKQTGTEDVKASIDSVAD